MTKVKETENLYDVAIIGAGVSGANIARQLSRYELRTVLLEKEADVGFGTSKANSGIVHGGFHHDKKLLKSRLEVQGASMFDRLAVELDFPFKRCGIVVVALHADEMPTIGQLYRRGVENGVIGIEMCSRERIRDLEPKLSPDAVGGLYAPGGGIVEPYRFVFSLIESAIKNGVALMCSFAVDHAERAENLWRVRAADGRVITARFVVNAAGLYADEVSRVFKAEDFRIEARKGEYYLLDRLAAAKVSRVVFPVPSAVSKGMLVIPTVEGTVLIGPSADAVLDKGDLATTGANLERILASARNMVPAVSETDVITSFAGLRPVLDEDFFIALSKIAPDFVQVAGIQSPGLTASPAIGEYVKDILKHAGASRGLRLVEKAAYDPCVDKRPRLKDASLAEADALVAQDSAWGTIVCRCEKVSEAEIVAAVRAGHVTLDGIKYFTRAQMGRCQGGFCTHKIIRIIMRETGMKCTDIVKRGSRSWIIRSTL